ncbi:TetR/AcrR family transcriptional regulator [Sphingomonas nostoxanthinifaciens]|uniref:TetR/AcrR family transcriptional regulator n=1 Tax=Sphingomonas nostoxanthinifaciens TaxID=2872652 RepID=UPI001CC1C8EA|nr:TetR/AcrR family transcriptional regulator [Sphingomonas nostoxanthinifaciens]UAK23110.1 TetR/AcrR family transcriptional regulator [Sphingomonas nostoxanthinifaciens]
MAEIKPGRRLGRPTLDEAAALRETFLDRAFDMLCERGVHGFSIDALAKVSGVTKRTIYRHYKSKNALIEAVVERRALRLTQIDDLRDRADLLPVERLRLWGLRIFRQLSGDDAKRLSLLLRFAGLTEPWAADMLDVWARRLIASASTLVVAAQESGNLRRCDPEILVFLLLDLIDGLFNRMSYSGQTRNPLDDASLDHYFQQRWLSFLQLARPDWSNP